MARRSDHTREELHEMALDAAENIVNTRGIGGLTAREVAREIGYAPGTLYNLFEDIDDLILHLNGRTLDRLRELLSAVELTGEPEADLFRLLDAYLGFLEQHPNLWNLLFDHKLPSDRAVPPWYAEKVDRLFGVAERAIAPLFPEGRAAERYQVARVLWASVHGFCALAASGKLDFVGERPVGDMARSLVSRYLAGLQSELAAA
jgi:AcrR family transcriptional regulator